MKAFSCKYHPDREAVTKCEKCGVMICLECKSIYRRQSSHHHSAHHRHRYSAQRYELCPECYSNQIDTAFNPICIVLPLIFIIFFISTASSMFSNSSFGAPTGFSAMFIIVPIIMICLLLYRYFIEGPQKKEEARRRKDQAIHGESLSFLRTN